MEGAALAATRRHDDFTTLAYQAACFRGISQSKEGLKPLAHYLIEKPERKEQTPADMLAVFQELQKRGAKINIRKLN